MIDFVTAQPLDRAIGRLSERTPLGSRMRTAEWARVPVELRERAFFSAGVEDVRFLQEAQDRILRRVALQRSRGGEGVQMDRARFIDEMKRVTAELGLRPDREDSARGGLQDVGSARRLGLIWDTQVQMAEGYSKWKMDQDPDLLEAAPAQQLIRVRERREKRPWPDRWNAAVATLGENTTARRVDWDRNPNSLPRMVALKTDPVWAAISRFAVPWPPFDFGSGMGLRNIRREVAQKEGLIAPGQELAPRETPFNTRLETSAEDLGPAAREILRDQMGDMIAETPESIAWTGRLSGPEATPQGDLADRAASVYRSLLGAIDEISTPLRILLGIASAVAVGRLRLHRAPMPQARGEALAAALQPLLGPEVRAEFSAGELLIWRASLAASAAELQAMGGTSEREGHGPPAGLAATAEVALATPEGDPLYSFVTPASTARIYGGARSRDLSHAWETPVEFHLSTPTPDLFA